MKRSLVQYPRRHLVQLVFLVSAATATTISVGSTALSLSNFQLIAEVSVPLGCLLAYNNPIQGCEATDFASKRTCSTTCTSGLARMQSTLQDACQAVQVQANTILGQALAGNLVTLLCDRQAQHHDSVHPAVDQRRQASSTTPATTGYYYSRPSTFTTGYNYCPPTSASAIYDVGTGTATSSSVFSSSTATATDYGRAARLQSSTAASTSHHHSHLYDHD
ncbi:heterokaryon incompatibility protein [Colletotrichum higginsianum]|nr:heterokaryon incompatibility protein [Colletotrichum higginsianum]